jgi:error-prone DNA polymerase
VGGAVKINLLIQRRRGLLPYSFDHPELERILGHTYGIVVFQEQIDELLQTFCRYTSGEAEDIRDAIHKRRREDYGTQIRDEILARILANGFSEAVAEQVFTYVAEFKGYGFAQGHALAFAEVSVRSIWCQQNHPSEYFASLLDAQPAGYYGPCTLVNEARSRGVDILPPDVCRSRDEFTVEPAVRDGLVVPQAAIRISLSQIAGLSAATRQRILDCQARAIAQAAAPGPTALSGTGVP